MKQYADNSPLNASIKVDYTKRRRRVWFSYPEKKGNWFRQTFKVIYPLFFLVYWIALFSSAAFLFFVGFVVIILEAIFFPSPQVVVGAVWTEAQTLAVIRLTLVCCFLFLPPLLPALWVGYHYKRFKTVIPKFQFWVSRLFEQVRRVKVRKLDSKVYVLPYFRNVCLKYDLKGDFAKKLVSIEVKPTVANYFKIFRGKEKKIQPRHWKAVFVFSDIPTDGELIIDFL